MPELPEVETIARRLQEVLPGKQFTQIQVLKDKSFSGDQSSLLGQQIDQVSRRAKYLRFHLDNDFNLLTHLKMTGQLIYLNDGVRLGGGHPTADWVQELPSRHTRIVYDFADGSKLFFNDMRIFGWMRLLSEDQINQVYQKLGPDINDPSLTVEYLQEALSRRSIPIKQAIMDNAVLCGVGNIYACDALNVAQISPFRPAKSLSEEELAKLLKAMKDVIIRGIELGGTTFDGKYVNVEGFAGGYQSELKAYGREGEPCLQCGGKIAKTKLGGRGTYYCPDCQV